MFQTEGELRQSISESRNARSNEAADSTPHSYAFDFECAITHDMGAFEP
jgi:hypothetical protein